jgi:hypothetical protein
VTSGGRHVELAKAVTQVRLHGVDADVEGAADVGVAPATGEQDEHLALALGEPKGAARPVPLVRGTPPALRGRLDDDRSPRDRLERVDEDGGRHRLRDHAAHR